MARMELLRAVSVQSHPERGTVNDEILVRIVGHFLQDSAVLDNSVASTLVYDWHNDQGRCPLPRRNGIRPTAS